MTFPIKGCLNNDTININLNYPDTSSPDNAYNACGIPLASGATYNLEFIEKMLLVLKSVYFNMY